ncbi:glycoside hydrolase family 16 protein [Sphaerobolus stellatus SS14]|uniref:Glycoside hydrolase family 16 protein n=1 Tax=Sphaerobolus stellatus (strain SS14) TaxID=990650 RepID=A0A0C9UD85_SPHS4|nr:glycoside hydrolase family 16 protein [Sphaerobolus stellatus SS14]
MLYTCLPVSFAVISLVVLAAVPFLVPKHSYTLTWELKGDDFFNEFDFWDSGNVSDPTADSTYPTAAYYMPKEAAQNQSLAYVTGQGNFRLGVDSTFTYHGLDLRPSVRITSHKTIQQGLIIIDAAHVAYALTAWPSIWLTDVSQPWPTAGEIDIYEMDAFTMPMPRKQAFYLRLAWIAMR